MILNLFTTTFSDSTIMALGFAATFLSSIYMIPQVIKLIKVRSVKEFSLMMFVILTACCLLWMIYAIAQAVNGVGEKSWLPLLISQIIQITFNLSMLIWKVIEIIKSKKTA